MRVGLWWLILTLLTSGGLLAEDVRMVRLGEQRTSFTPEKVAPPLSLLWKFSTGEDKGFSSMPLVVGNRVFYCSLGAVYSLDVETGAVVWGPYETRYDIRMTPLYHNGLLFVGNDKGQLHVLDASDEGAGRVVEVLDVGTPIRSEPIIVGDTLWMVTYTGRLFGINLTNWDGSEEPIEEFQSGPNGALVHAGDFLYWTGRDNIVYCFDIDRGRPKWAKSQGNQVTGATFGNDLVYVGQLGEVRALKPRVGTPEWRSRGVDSSANPPSLANGRLFVAGRDDYVYALNPEDGKVLGRSPVTLDSPVMAALTVADQDIYAGTRSGNVFCLDANDLSLKWYYRTSPVETIGPETAGYPVAAPVVAGNGYVLAVTTQGTLFCLAPDAIDLGEPRLFQPQLVTNAVDNTLVAFPLYDDAWREEAIAAAEFEAGRDEEPEIPEEAEMLELPAKQQVFRFETYIYDEGSGFPIEAINVTFDGQPHPSNLMYISPFDNLLRVDLVDPEGGRRRAGIPDGEHTLAISVPDFKGNVLERRFTIKVDNTLPPIEPPEEEPAVQPGMDPGMMDPGMMPPPPA